MTKDWPVSAAYAGTETDHLWVTYQLNPATIVPCANGVLTSCNSTANTQARRVISLLSPANGKYLGPVDQFDSSGTSSYNAMILTANRQLAKGVNVNANYTWSHCIGDSTQAATVGGAQAGLLEPYNRRFDRGNCQSPTLAGSFGLDRRQIVNLTAVAQSPRFSNRTLRAVATGWLLAGSWRANVGASLTATMTTDVQLSGTGGQRPNQILADPLCANPSASCWINPAAFATPAPGTLGNLGRSSIPGPGFWEIDMALSRDFRIRERQTFEIRAEAFNLTNSFRAGIASGASAGAQTATLTQQNSPQFGQILNALDPRIMQVAAKFVF